MGAIALPVMVGAAALATEYGYALCVQTEHQRTADLASYAGALAYGQTQSEETMRAAVRNITDLHSIKPTEVAAQLIPSPRNPDVKAVKVVILSPRAVALAKILGAENFSIHNTATAEIGSDQAGACILALDPDGEGIALSGGAALKVPKCGIASNAAITKTCGVDVVAKSATYNTGAPPVPSHGCAAIRQIDGKPSPISKASTPDPLADHAGVLAAVNRLELLSRLVRPSGPEPMTGPDLDFNPWDQTKRLALTQALASQGCTGAYATKWTVTCVGTRFAFGHFVVSSSILVEFNLNGAANAAYSFKSISSEGGGQYRFGPGTYSVPGGISMGGDVASFGAGTFWIGPGPCGFSICGGNNGTMRFAGPSRFELSHGIKLSGSHVMTLGSGTTNAFRLGPSVSGKAIETGSGTLVLADAAAGPFEVTGRIESGGGSCLVLSAAPRHEVVGSLDMQGALIMGAGFYAISGYLALGAQGGGTQDCNDQGKVSLLARDVTIALAGQELPSSSTCRGAAYCAAAGYRDIVLTAPTTGTYAGLALVGPTRLPGGATLSGGASDAMMRGAVYFPTGPIALSGSASVSDRATGCLALVGLSLSLSAGTEVSTGCERLKPAGGAGMAGKTARLVN